MIYAPLFRKQTGQKRITGLSGMAAGFAKPDALNAPNVRWRRFVRSLFDYITEMPIKYLCYFFLKITDFFKKVLDKSHVMS